MQPLIGLSCSFDSKGERYFLPETYVEALIKAGGVPILLPGSGSIKTVKPYFEHITGLMLTGGGDIDPTYFNEEPIPGIGEITPDRDRFEMMLVKIALRKKLPIFGICRGIQVLNVACGGTLVQHIASQVKGPLNHAQNAPRWYPTHAVTLNTNSKLAGIIGKSSLKVNSFHHQSVKETADGLNSCARSSDGVIEAIEHPGHAFTIGVQWHPEGLVKDKYAVRLFRAFTEAALHAQT